MKSLVFAGRWVAGCLLVSVLVSGCTPRRSARPAWIYSREHQTYPGQQYLLGLGQATTLELAEKNALDDLRGQLKIKAAGAWQGQPMDWFDPFGFQPEIAEHLPSEIVLRWSSVDGKLHAALAACERSRLAKPLAESTGLARDACLNAGKETESAASSGDSYRALKHTLQALKACSELAAHHAVGLSLTGKRTSTDEFPDLRDLASKAAGLLRAIRLQAVAGEGQRITLAGGLQEPLVVAVRLTGKHAPVPLAGVPIRFRQGESEVVSTRSSDLGLASAELNSGLAGAKSSIDAMPDINQILSDAGIDPADPRFAKLSGLLEKTRSRFSCLSPGEKRLRVLLAVTETIGDEASQEPVMAAELSRALQKAGFDVVTLGDLPEAFQSLTDPTELRAAAKEHVRIIIQGDLQATPRAVAENFVFSEISGTIEVVDLASQTTLAVVEQPVKSAGLDVYSASARAFSSLSQKALPEVVQAIKKQLESP